MADAQTPVEPPRAYAGRERGAWEHGYAAGLAAQPDRAVMQQALDALEVCRDALEHIREAGGYNTSAEIVAETAIAALSATMEKPA